MNFIKSIAIVLMLVGLGIIISAFIDSTWQLPTALALAGLGFISLGLIQVKRVKDSRRDEKRLEQIMTKLEEIQQELKKEDQPKGTGVVIADVISSGLKYYTEHMTKQKKEEDND